jgi:hypothetical protein
VRHWLDGMELEDLVAAKWLCVGVLKNGRSPLVWHANAIRLGVEEKSLRDAMALQHDSIGIRSVISREGSGR